MDRAPAFDTDHDDAEVFLAFDPGDAAAAGELGATLATHLPGTTFTVWAAEADPREAGGFTSVADRGAPMFYDTAGRAIVTDERIVRRALGVLAVIGEHAAGSALLRYQLETAYSHGVEVLGVRTDPEACPPRNLSSTAVVGPDSDLIGSTVRRWRDRAQQQATLPWLTRIRQALVADRAQRG